MATPVKNLRGKRFGKLLVLRRAGRNKWGQARWLIKCDCGTRDVVEGYFLTGNAGYQKTQCPVCSHPQRGMSKTHIAEWMSWSAMKSRCLCETNESYKTYGGRGIRICDRWLGPNGFVNFVMDMGRRREGKTLDRINPEGDYTPENCRWASKSTQTANRRCNYTDEELKVMQEQADEQRRKMEEDAAYFVNAY
jgi:hypothetical protein